MSEPLVIVDTGPLVASLVVEDEHHDWAARTIAGLPAPLVTSEPVITEACFLLQRRNLPLESLFALLDRESLIIGFELQAESGAVQPLLKRYRNLPMSLADASLVRLAEIHDHAHVFTLDHHFRIYRKHGRRTIPLIVPDDAH